MKIFNLSTTSRQQQVSPIDFKNLVKGIALLAIGFLAISCITIHIAFSIKILLFAAGIGLCVASGFFFSRYAKEVKR